MSVSEMFREFLDNISIKNSEQISARYGEITRALNQKYRDSESKINNTMQVGSYGRYTGINGISDLDMIYMLPSSEWSRFKDGRQSALLQEVKKAIEVRYPKTNMRGDGQVVVVSFSNHVVEILPVFELEDGSFKYPDTNDGGSWKITKPRAEIKAMKDLNDEKNRNLRRLCKMTRAWKNKHGVNMSGMLIDTLAYNFLNTTDYYDDKSYTYYDFMVRDFFEYLSNESNQSYYLAPGSNQQVHVKKRFQAKAKKAYSLCIKAIDAEEQVGVNKKWKKLFGRSFPAAVEIATESARTWVDTEEFIEDKYPIGIRYNLRIDCVVSQQGFQPHSLREMLQNMIPLLAKKQLLFKVKENNVPEPFEYKWKVLNRGSVSKTRDMIRGQIIDDDYPERKEKTDFTGGHEVECYVVKNGIVVARDSIDVPIKEREADE